MMQNVKNKVVFHLLNQLNLFARSRPFVENYDVDPEVDNFLLVKTCKTI